MLYTAEYVTPKHPDKVCDRISDAILDECLKQDPNSRVAIETMGGHGIITVTGELTTNAYIDVKSIVKKVLGKDYGVQVNIVKQSSDIANGVDTGGAGDQGIMVGYACNGNVALLPMETFLARNLCRYIYKIYEEDGKTQITIDDKGNLETVVASFNNAPKKELEELVHNWLQQIDESEQIEITVLKDLKLHINPAGDWSIGSFDADTGLTGRKLVVDNYGPRVPIGGGAFSGKDSTKVDRTGAYWARNLAVELLINWKQAEEAIVYLAFAIGVDKPVAIIGKVRLKGSHTWNDIVLDNKLTVKEIIDRFKLKEPNFEKTAEWGAFGNDFLWDMVTKK